MAAPQSIIDKYSTYLKHWIEDCNKNHGKKCQVDAERLPHQIPDWVIDTKDGCIVPGRKDQEYAALSYVWNCVGNDDVGGRAAAEDRLILKKKKLVNFCRQGYLRSSVLEKVPVVIQDAINFVQSSGFRYLWVDSLCIVQDDETTRDGVGLMNEIYSGAYFTIIAAASTKGLYGNNNYDHALLPHDSTEAQYLHNKLLCSHWASRGWTFQEQLLSKRSIVFLDNYCFWDCQRTVLWPCSLTFTFEYWRPDPFARNDQLLEARQTHYNLRHPYQRVALERLKRKYWSREEPNELTALSSVWKLLNRDELDRDESRDLTALSSVPDFGFYMELVCRYGNRNFTYDQDVIPAFSGVLEALSRRSFLGGFIYGLPALFLDSALLWQPRLKARRRSPVGTATTIAPMAPLPSWSWAGWQCVVDPSSLESGLDYVAKDFGFESMRCYTPLRTWKLVDWSILSDDGSVRPVDEPALLQSFKACQEGLHHSLHTEWSRDVTGVFNHASKPMDRYRYPLPTQNTYSTTVPYSNTSFLSCTTRMASLRVRRVLVPCGIYGGNHVAHLWSDTLVVKTDLYNSQPELHEVCPVITLEDEKGRWAGAMTVMENTYSVQSGSEITMIAISTGSAFQEAVAASYPEMIDSEGYWCYGSLIEKCRFRPLDWRGGLDNGSGQGEFSAAECARESLNAGIDVGPFASRQHRDNTSAAIGPTASAGSDPPELYHFYNVLWVETIEGVMYRKAVGRVPKEVWELNCGELTKIVLG